MPATNFSELLFVPRKEILPLIGPLVRASFSPSLCLNFLLLVSIVSDCKRWLCVHAKSFQSCLTLCDPMNCSLPGSSVHGILQARILEWIAIFFSRASSWLRDQTRCSSWDGMGGGWDVQEGGDICITISDSCYAWQKPTQYYKAIIL